MTSTSSGTRMLVGFTSFACGAVALGALVSIGFLYQDINEFYDEARRDLDHFQVCS